MVEKGFMERTRKIAYRLKADGPFIAAIAVACIVRIYLAGTQSYWALGGYYDDALQNNQALSLCQRNWLGEYGETTLIKGISFPVFLALRRLLHIPYGVLLGLFICASCIVLLFAMRKVYKGKVFLFLAFCLVLFCPIAWCSDAGARIYRNVLSPWAILVIFSCLLALFQLRHANVKKWVPWLVLLGLALAFSVNLREDTAWTYPAVAATLVWMLIAKVRKSLLGKKASRRTYEPMRCLGAICIPIAICLLCSGGISLLNHHYYGVFEVNDRAQGAFSNMVGEISAIRDDAKSPRDQWFTRDMLNKAIDESPSLGSIREELDASYDVWVGHFGGGIVKGDYLQWVLRSAMASAGLFQSASAAQSFSAQVAQELNAAFEDGRLEHDSLFHPSTQGPGLSVSDCISFIPDSISNLTRILCFTTTKEWFPLYTKLADEDLGVFQYTTGLSFSNESQDSGYGTFRLESAITAIYQIASPLLFGVAIVALVAAIACDIRKRTWKRLSFSLFCAVVLLGSTLLFVFMVTIFITFLGGTWPLQFYATPAYVLFLMFDAVVMLDIARTVRAGTWKRRRKLNVVATP